uniref:Bifunctional inhibitor/plant lipid transfer protein/seed storage helical domain-containing protein n=1 Tax=Lilium longiflorum TaxID=4690 RepID=B2BAA7_LILLO|nr:unknown [Lilium longiflorum]
MASFMSLVSFSSLVLLVVIAVHSPVALSQDEECLAGIGNLISCDPYVIPGANQGSPSKECCSALGGVKQSCYCTAIDIISNLPARCSLPAVNCA